MVEKPEELQNKFNLLVENLKNIDGISFDEIIELTSHLVDKQKTNVPLEVLKNRDLGVLESLTVHLKDEQNMKFSEIDRALERDDRTIWATYHKAKKKVGNVIDHNHFYTCHSGRL